MTEKLAQDNEPEDKPPEDKLPESSAATSKNVSSKTAEDETAEAQAPEPSSPEASPFEKVAPLLRKALVRRGFSELSAVQKAVLAASTEARDLQISSQTGSGKTVALGFVLADDLIRTAEDKGQGHREVGPNALIITPTRELAIQVADELTWLFANVPGVRVDRVTGGTHVGEERRRLSRKPSILVGTPGRLLDHIRTRALNCQGVRQVLLDEADQMLDMGFREELEGILDATPKERHTHLVSATFPAGIRKLARNYQKDPLHIEGTRLGEANADIEHIVHLVHHRDRYPTLVNLLLLQQGERTLVFVSTRAETAELSEKLLQDGFSATAISGDLQQNQRNRTLAAFRAGTVDVMVATDVAARGLDIPNVSLVIHGTAPRDGESYTHRSGRTGRAGSPGRSILLAPNTARYRVERLLSQARVDARWHPAPDVKAVEKRLAKNLKREIFEALHSEEPPAAADLTYANRLITENDPAQVVAILLNRVRGQRPTNPRELGSFPPEPARRGFREGPPGRSGRSGPGNFSGGPSRGGPQRLRGDSKDWVRFSINWGFRFGATTRRLLALACRRGDINGRQVGAIDIGPTSSTFEVAAGAADAFDKRASRPDERDPKIQIRRMPGGSGGGYAPRAKPSASGWKKKPGPPKKKKG